MDNSDLHLAPDITTPVPYHSTAQLPIKHAVKEPYVKNYRNLIYMYKDHTIIVV